MNVYLENFRNTGDQKLIAELGFGLYEYSVSILLLSLVVFALVHLFVVVYEEPGLKARFGVTYSQYCAGVPRWIPHLRR